MPEIYKTPKDHYYSTRRDSTSYTAVDMYYDEDYTNPYNLELKDYVKILETFNDLFAQSIVETGYDFVLPNRLGFLSIKKRKQKSKTTDYKYYLETGHLRKYINKATEGYRAKFYWDQRQPQASFRNRTLYKFYPVRTLNRTLAKKLKEENYITKYFEYE